jgi:hypothetical protein
MPGKEHNLGTFSLRDFYLRVAENCWLNPNFHLYDHSCLVAANERKKYCYGVVKEEDYIILV